jgi:hypothetical protein
MARTAEKALQFRLAPSQIYDLFLNYILKSQIINLAHFQRALNSRI